MLPTALPEPIRYESQREFVREVLASEVDLRAVGTEIVPSEPPDGASARYRKTINADGSPSETVAAGWIWRPGTELAPHNGHTVASGDRAPQHEGRLL